MPNVTIEVLTPSQEGAHSTIVVEQGRPVRVMCSVQGMDSLSWYKIIDGMTETSEANTKMLLDLWQYPSCIRPVISMQ